MEGTIITKKESINRVSLSQRLKGYTRRPLSAVLLLATLVAATITLGAVFVLLSNIFTRGIPVIFSTPELFAWEFHSSNLSMMPAIITTLIMIVLTLIIAAPVGIASAVYLVEYAKKGNKLVKIIRLTTETLAGIPSIVFGLFGFIVFVNMMSLGYSIIGGAFTLSIMILPIIVRTTEEALIAFPDLYREGSYGLGAGKIRTIFRIVLPGAVPGILAGVILSIGRISGETAALIFTAGSSTGLPDGLTSSARTLSVHLFALVSNPQAPLDMFFDAAYATATVLVFTVVGVNMLSNYIAKKFNVKN
ncbi:MAG: phosphate ABC transporter permease PstA [Oscillospiraceae bacterium]|nr:phosphate ABC transporter permease PstA [Oscillospiraceae bacterium]